MSTAVTLVDPRGDVVLVLDSRNTAVGSDKSPQIVLVKDVKDGALYSVSDSDSDWDSSDGGSSAEEEDLNTPSFTAATPDEDESGKEEEPACGSRDFTIRVSSRHLKLASPVFEALLAGRFQESSKLQSAGSTEVYLPEDFPEGLTALMNIIHGKFRNLRKTMTPQLLMQITLLVDKYALHETIEPFIQRWYGDVQDAIPKGKWDPDIMHWIAICLVLNISESFQNLTYWALRKGPDKASAEGLPVSRVVDELERRKRKLLKDTFQRLAKIEKKCWRDPQQEPAMLKNGDKSVEDFPKCTEDPFECDAMVLGTLQKRLACVGLWPLPDESHISFELEHVARKLEKIKIVTLCRRKNPSNFATCRNFTEDEVKEIAQRLRRKIRGLDIERFRNPHWS